MKEEIFGKSFFPTEEQMKEQEHDAEMDKIDEFYDRKLKQHAFETTANKEQYVLMTTGYRYNDLLVRKYTTDYYREYTDVEEKINEAEKDWDKMFNKKYINGR